jgi:hypothetical protein
MKINSVDCNADRHLVFNGVADPRYTFPVWSAMSRRHRVYFVDGDIQVTFESRLGHIEVFAKAAAHRELL